MLQQASVAAVPAPQMRSVQNCDTTCLAGLQTEALAQPWGADTHCIYIPSTPCSRGPKQHITAASAVANMPPTGSSE